MTKQFLTHVSIMIQHSKGNIMQNTNFGIVKTFNENDFINEFKAYKRMDNFRYKGLRILFESLEQTAQDCGIDIEMDVIALCCEYSEDDLQYIIDNYDIDMTDCDSIEEKIETVEYYLQDNTFVCGQYEDEDGVTYFVYQSF